MATKRTGHESSASARSSGTTTSSARSTKAAATRRAARSTDAAPPEATVEEPPTAAAADSHEAHAGSDPAAEGVAHLQSAARELISAGRKLLDAAEQLMDDPKVASSVGAGLAGLAKLAGEVLATDALADVGRAAASAAGWGSAGNAAADPVGAPERADPGEPGAPPGRRSRVTRIPVD